MMIGENVNMSVVFDSVNVLTSTNYEYLKHNLKVYSSITAKRGEQQKNKITKLILSKDDHYRIF